MWQYLAGVFTIAFGDNMNERFKELEKQCWSHRVDGILVDGHLHFDTQKFAELIVQECAEWINDNVGLIDEKARADLLKHFGAERCGH